MFTNKSRNGRNNVSGERIAEIRKRLPEKLSQRGLADLLQCNGVDVDKNAVQRIESGKRFVTDIELAMIAKVLGVKMEDLIEETQLPKVP